MNMFECAGGSIVLNFSSVPPVQCSVYNACIARILHRDCSL